MKSGIIFCIILVLTIGTCLAGWERTYGGSENDLGWSVAQTTDGGYIVAGRTRSFGAGSWDVYLVKTSPLGDTIWTRTYGGSDDDYGYSVAQTTDGGYIVAGMTNSFGADGSDVFLVKTDAAGDTLWTRTYGESSEDNGRSIAQTSDGGYIVAGETGCFATHSNDVYIVKTNAAGDTLWTRTYGGSDWDYGRSVAQTTDGGYIVTGWTSSFGAGGPDVYVLKLSSSGDTVWTRTYGGSDSDVGSSVTQTSDGGYIVTGWTASFGAGYSDFYLVKTDFEGDTLWTRTYGGSDRDYGESVAQTSDGGYIVAGKTESFGAGSYDFYLVKTDALGDTIWTRTYGGSGYDEARSVSQTPDGGYIVAGRTRSFGAGDYDVYLIKTDSLGYTGIGESPTARPEDIAITAYPNPFNSAVTIRFSVLGSGFSRIEIFDINGKMVGSLGAPITDNRTPITEFVWMPDESIGSGIYLVRIKGTNAATKIIYMK